MNCLKKTRKRIRSVVIVALICTLIMPTMVFAATPTYYDHRMTGGISNVYIYIDDKGSPRATYWQNLIKSAVNNWMYTGVGANKFYCKGYVSSGTSGSKIDFYARSAEFFGSATADTLAWTTFWDYDINQVNQYGSDWYSALIDINDTELRKDEYSNDDAIFVFIHEMGHAMGLAHNEGDPYSVMYPSLHGCKVRRVQKTDNDTLNRLYY